MLYTGLEHCVRNRNVAWRRRRTIRLGRERNRGIVCERTGMLTGANFRGSRNGTTAPTEDRKTPAVAAPRGLSPNFTRLALVTHLCLPTPIPRTPILHYCLLHLFILRGGKSKFTYACKDGGFKSSFCMTPRWGAKHCGMMLHRRE